MSILRVLVLVCMLTPAAGADDTPDHLEPIPVYHLLADYDRLVYKTLIRDTLPLAWMIARPSFEPEYAIILKQLNTADSVGNCFELEYARANKLIWYSLQQPVDSEVVIKPDADIEIERQQAVIPKDVAADLFDVWTRVLKQTRYREEECPGLDGVTYQFCVLQTYCGQTWSPQSGVPRLMIDSGRMLIEYVQAREDKRDKSLHRLKKVIETIKQQIE